MRAMLPARLTVVLDANDGEGWDLAEGLLRPREVRWACWARCTGRLILVDSWHAAREGTARLGMRHSVRCSI